MKNAKLIALKRGNTFWERIALGLVVVFSASVTQADTARVASVYEMSIEDLMDLQVTSVSKKQQSVKNSAAAIFVLTQNDIRRSTARSIPELLRLVPGLHVARVDGNRWAVTARGSNSLFANKLLVLIDGRTVYTPVFSGVYWDAQDTLLADVERIEVIRGPGASLWGANAVNGVINIITKSSKETHGGFASAGGGNIEQGFAEARYGVALNSTDSVRVYGKFHNYANQELSGGETANDGLRAGQGGFRADVDDGPMKLTTQGDIYAGNSKSFVRAVSFDSLEAVPYRQEGRFSGGNLLTRASYAFNSQTEGQIQLYYDRANRNDALLDSVIDTYDIDAQFRFKPGQYHEVTSGVSYRRIEDDLRGIGLVSFDPDSRGVSLVGAFLQDEIQLNGESLKLVLGTKFEHHDFVGAQYQPTARLMWQASDDVRFWGAVSRADALPSRAENDIDLTVSLIPNDPLPIITSVRGNRRVPVEDVYSYEVGARWEFSRDISFDLATFYSHDPRSRTYETGSPALAFNSSGSPYLSLPLTADSKARLDTYGSELAFAWQPTGNLRIQGWYSYLRALVELDSDGNDLDTYAKEGSTPRNQALLRASLDLSETWEVDVIARYVGTASKYKVDSYTELDLRLGYSLTEDLDLSLVGVGLLAPSRVEYGSEFVNVAPSEIQRGFFGTVNYRF